MNLGANFPIVFLNDEGLTTDRLSVTDHIWRIKFAYSKETEAMNKLSFKDIHLASTLLSSHWLLMYSIDLLNSLEE